MVATFLQADSRCFTSPAGNIYGRIDGDILCATGIRYARAKRFAPPIAERDADTPIMAINPSLSCTQSRERRAEIVMGRDRKARTFDEQCQRLSITLPADVAPDELLPVMIWIHGGSYTNGAGDAPICNPAMLVREQRVIVVTVTYRLGIFGFLGGWQDIPANLGLLDMIEALRWVNRNISAFYGDPSRVTLFGESAGGDAIAHLMIAEGTRGLFQRVIIQSAPLSLTAGRATMTADMINVARKLDPLLTVDDINKAQSVISAAASARHGILGGMPFGPQYGARPLPSELQRDAAWQASAPHIDVLIGYTRREIAFFTPSSPILRQLKSTPLIGKSLHELAIIAASWVLYGRSAKTFAGRHRSAGGRAYHYRLDWGLDDNPFAGAHTIDLPLLLGNQAAWASAPMLAGGTWPEIEGHGRPLRKIWADFAQRQLGTTKNKRSDSYYLI
jgi:para-nitrobenzyl esterase